MNAIPRPRKLTQAQYEAMDDFDALMNRMSISNLENIIDAYDATIQMMKDVQMIGGDPEIPEKNWRMGGRPDEHYASNLFDRVIAQVTRKRDAVHLILARKQWEIDRPRSGARARLSRLIGGC